MNQKQQSPQGGIRGLTIKESLNLLRKNLPQPAPSVNEECAACAYFHESIQGKKNSRRAHSVCAFSGSLPRQIKRPALSLRGVSHANT